MTSTLPELAPALSAVLERHADRLDLDLIDRALRFSASAHRGQKRMSGEDFVSHSIAVALILAEQLLDTRHHRRRAAPRRGGGLRRPHRGHRPRVRRRDRRHRGRAHQDLQPHLPLLRRRAGRELPEAAAVDRQGRAGHHHQAGRPAAQHADARAPLRPSGGSRIATRDAGDLRPAGAPLRHGGHQGGAGGPRLQVPGAGRLSRPGQPGGRQARGAGADHPQARGRRSRTSSSARASTGSRSPAGPSTSGPSSRRCGSGTRASTRSTT